MLQYRRNIVYKNTGNSGIFNIGSSSTVENNTVVSNTGGITNITSNSSVVVRNNIVAFNNGNGIHTTVSPAPTTKFNDVYLNTTNYSGYSSTYGNLTSTNRRGDPSDAFSNIGLSPLFVDTSSQNYHLQATSHMIDAGDTLSAKDPDGTIADIGAYYYVAPPGAPTQLLPSATENNAATTLAFSWTAISGSINYRLQIIGDTTLTTFLVDSTGTGTSRTIKNLPYDSTLYWRVNVTLAAGTSNFTSFRKFITRLSPPVISSAVPVGTTKAQITWAKIKDAAYYPILQSVNDTLFVKIDSTALLQYTDSVLTPGKQYWLKVAADRSSGSSGDSSIAATVITNPAAPTILSGTPLSDVSVQFTWQPNGIAARYKIYKSLDSLTFVKRDSTTLTTYADTGLTALTSYWYKVTALNSSGVESNASNVVKITTKRPLSRITAFQVPSSNQHGVVKFPFTFQIGSPDTIIIKVSYSLDSGKTFTPTTNVSGVLSGLFATTNDTLIWNSLSDIPGVQSQQTRMKILPIGKLDTGVVYLSSAFTVDNKAPVFAGVQTATGDTNRVVLGWNHATDLSLPITYKIFLSQTSKVYNFATPDTSVTDTVATVRSLINFQRYYFIVRAVDALGNSDTNSIEVNATAGRKAAIVSITTPTAPQKGDVKLPYHLTSLAADSVQLTVEYSTNAGTAWNTTQNLTGKTVGIQSANYLDTLIWHSASEGGASASQSLAQSAQINNYGKFSLHPHSMTAIAILNPIESDSVEIRITPTGRGGIGTNLATSPFAVDNKPPVFAGALTASGDTNKVTLRWNHAADLTLPITYKIFLSQSSGTYNFATPDTSIVTDTVVTVRSLNNFQKYYFVVRAMDGVGNIDTNTVEVSAVPSVKASILAITTPAVAQKGDVKIPYHLTSIIHDSVQLTVEYSTNAGTAWNTTQNLTGKTTGIQSVNYLDTLIWHSASEGGASASQSAAHSTQNNNYGRFSLHPHSTTAIAIANPIESDSVKIRITPTGRGGVGTGLATSPFAVDNKPPVFAGLTSATSDTTGTSVILSWSHASDLSNPIMYYLFGGANSPTINYTQSIDNTRDTVITEKKLTTFVTYHFSVRAEDAVGNLEQDTVSRFVTPTRIVKVSAFAITPNTYRTDVPISVMLDAASNDTASMSLFYSTDNGISWNSATTITGKVSSITLFDSLMTLHWNPLTDIPNYEGFAARMQITTKGRGGVGNSSTSGTFAIDTKAPRFNGLFSVASNDTSLNGSALLSWQTATDTSKPITYLIYGSDSSSLNYIPVDSTLLTTYVYRNLQFNSTYNFAVRARDAVGNVDSNKTTISYSKPPLGSFNGDRLIDAQDLTIFANAWRTNNVAVGDIGPATGTPPNLQPQRDGKIDFEDLLVFVRMWNWSFHNNPQGGVVAKSSSNVQTVSNTKVTLAFPSETVLKPGQSEKFALSFNDDSISVATVGVEINYNPSAIGIDSVILPSTNDAIAISDVDSVGGVLHAAIASISMNSLQKCTQKIPLQLLLRAKKKLEEEKVTLVYDLYSQDARLISHQETEQSFNWRPVIPDRFDLSQNYPNPFNPTTKIDYQLVKDNSVAIQVYNILGQEVKTLVNQLQKAGYYTIEWDGTNNCGTTVSSGVYFLRLRTQGFVSTKKMMMLR